MENKNHLEMLLSNFRFLEAIGYISALVDTEKLSADRGEVYENFIRAYEQVVCNSLWNEEGMFILSTNKIDDVAFKDINEERNRLISLINECLQNQKRPILLFVSAYYSVINIDGLRMEMYLDEILKEMKNDSIMNRVSKALGGYEKFQAVGNVLESYYHLNESIFKIIKKLTINIQQ